MQSTNFMTGENPGKAQQEMLDAELFLKENYLFRRNELSKKVEYVTLPLGEDEAPQWQPLSEKALNSIVLRAKREQVCGNKSPRTDITEYVNSNDVQSFNPIADYLNGLPKWDGQNHVAKLFNRLPGVDSERMGYLSTWLRSVVAHWLQMDTVHGNECVPTLIGAQGCGKTTFIVRLLPPHLREYYLDHLNLSNKFDKEMALTNNLLVNLDELDAIRDSQLPALKQTLSKNKVNARPIFGQMQEDRLRYASFVATTNNPHPLKDATGSRRYICLTIPHGQYIDNTGQIDYDQLYAQVLHELRVQESPYWFNNEEVARIQLLNAKYMEKKDMVDMVCTCFRKPEKGEPSHSMNCNKLLEVITSEFPSLKVNHSTKISLGKTMKALGYDSTECSHVAHYKVVPLLVA